MQSVKYLVLRFNRFAKTKVVVSFFENLEVYFFIRFNKLRGLRLVYVG